MGSLPSIYQRYSAPLTSLPVDVTPRLPRLHGVRAVILDIYGTIVISGTGDIGTSAKMQREGLALKALHAVCPNLDLPAEVSLTTRLTEAIQIAHQRDQHQGITTPEVDIREIWHEVLEPYVSLPTTEIETLAATYEALTNPVWPMPHAVETLTALQERQLTLGIISNAQFYTPALLSHFFPALTPRSDLCLYSYQERQAKPGLHLYEQMVTRLSAYDIHPSEVLYVGNDMRNDINPARLVGFRTALVATDQRSYRPRPEAQYPAADALITDLSQLLQLIGN